MHIADDFFLSYPSRDVQLLIACCIADVLRVYAPEAPYKDPGQVKVRHFYCSYKIFLHIFIIITFVIVTFFVRY